MFRYTFGSYLRAAGYITSFIGLSAIAGFGAMFVASSLVLVAQVTMTTPIPDVLGTLFWGPLFASGAAAAWAAVTMVLGWNTFIDTVLYDVFTPRRTARIEPLGYQRLDPTYTGTLPKRGKTSTGL